ncbi:hypothetical protein HZ993_22095 [Rhodoferax sp. AJA081-3]|uniref:hypothetical protein n=1 Tax=Rhodoferax sp. AJA081-3 TaxID=2752316 RepID=UPI001ADF1597|nr:hypothetical protein [Rhodoferax sp. AJA081-3]QTN27914.1 hypothetical protein HZ993_22095 [Rhodoferax sp. AJA081-3]
MQLRALVIKSVTTGSFAALAMVPFGFAFRVTGMRVGHYGPKFAELYSTNPGPALLFAQHMVLGWISAVPLVWALAGVRSYAVALLMGAAYGVAYYVVINALALPIYFADMLPWNLGLPTVVPSLVVHAVFGLAVAYAERGGFWGRRVD